MRIRTFQFGLAALVVFALAACGGGAASTATPAAPAPAATTEAPQAAATSVASAPIATTEAPQTAATSVAAAPTAPAAETQVANPPAATAYDKLLTPADVEQATGLKGVKLVPKDPSKGAGGDLNFAQQDGKLVLMVSFLPASVYDAEKKLAGAVKEEVSGIGDDAYSGPADDANVLSVPNGPVEPNIFSFRKGSQSADLLTYLNIATSKLYIGPDQLRELAKLVASRM